MSQTILITGASAGIGRATAEHFANNGWNVAATMRTPAKAGDLANHPNVKVFALDVTDKASIHSAVESTREAFGGLDVVLNNAGYAAMGALEATTEEQYRRQFDTNFFGVINVIKAVLPHFRQQQRGLVVNVSSILGRMAGLPFASAYNSSKFAVEGLTESIFSELKLHGIGVKIIEPGGVNTDFFAGMELAKDDNAVYNENFTKMTEALQANAASFSTPAFIAEGIYKAVTDGTPQLRYILGEDATQWWAGYQEHGDTALLHNLHQNYFGTVEAAH